MEELRLADVSEAVARLDPALRRLAEVVGPYRLRPPNPDGHFGALVHAIVFQQLAGRAASAIHARVRALVDGPLSPQAVLALPEEALRGAGLSAAKTASIRDLAGEVLDGRVVLDGTGELSDEEMISRLVTVRGIGRWTAEMFLLFELHRLDIWPVTDRGVRSGYALIWNLAAAPDARGLHPLGDRFRPYRSVVAWYCWQAVHLDRGGVVLP